MANGEDVRRVEIGFSGGQAIALRIGEDDYERLRKSVREGGGWQELDTDDGVVALDLSQVVFVKRESSEQTIGFAGA